MGAAAIVFPQEAYDEKYLEMVDYLSSEGGYWKNTDIWVTDAEAFLRAGIETGFKGKRTLADFSGYHNAELKTEVKFFLLHMLKERRMPASSIYAHYRKAVTDMGYLLGEYGSLNGMDNGDRELWDSTWSGEYRRLYLIFKRDAIRYLTDFYDEGPEFEKDVWRATKIPGAKVSAADLRQKRSMSFKEIPEFYRETVRRFMERLVVRRSWSHCREMLVYIRYFFKVFYAHAYGDGFFQEICRRDMERYLGWVAADYADKNATFRSKAVTYIRQFMDYIQLAEYELAPKKDVAKLLFDDDIPRRERAEDTMNKVKYIPAPVREQLDANLQELEPEQMRPVYVLLRESGWRGTDVLNLRYDSCLEYLWSGKEKEYIPYLCGEITKTGIPLIKIPIRPEVADMVKELAANVKEQSTDGNNPDRYLFNTFEGKNIGLPYSKPAFSKAVQELIDKKRIQDGDGNPYHFKAHSLRHTRAQEYTEQGMPISIIQQVLGHCSLQMTLHYAKVSENMLYEKWKETEKLNLLHLDSRPPQKGEAKEEGLHYEFVRKNLDAVKVPLGVCFKPSKLSCRQQMNPCLECANFCTCSDNIPEYESEIERLKTQLELSRKLGRDEWVKKNQGYLETLETMLARIRTEGLIHKAGQVREERDGR